MVIYMRNLMKDRAQEFFMGGALVLCQRLVNEPCAMLPLQCLNRRIAELRRGTCKVFK